MPGLLPGSIPSLHIKHQVLKSSMNPTATGRETREESSSPWFIGKGERGTVDPYFGAFVRKGMTVCACVTRLNEMRTNTIGCMTKVG